MSSAQHASQLHFRLLFKANRITTPESVLGEKKKKATSLPAVDNKVTDVVYIPLILFFEGPLHSSVDSQEAPGGLLQPQH